MHHDLLDRLEERSRALLPALRASGRGHVVNVGSTTTIELNPALGLSNAHRMATIGFLKTLAREVAGDDHLVAGAVGPLGVRIEPYGPTSRDEARDMFREQLEEFALAIRGQGTQLLQLAEAKAPEAPTHRANALKRFETSVNAARACGLLGTGRAIRPSCPPPAPSSIQAARR